jgi:diaminopimelate decarboxylase
MNRFDTHFNYKGNDLACDGMSVRSIAAEFGTPLYLYSEKGFVDRLDELKNALKGIDNVICYSIKTNSNLSIIKLMKEHGSGMDVVSGGELYRALKAGVDPSKIVYAGAGKTEEEIKYAIDSKILMFNCESFQEIEEIDMISAEKKVVTDIAIRVNPDVDANTHHYITTGKKENKFGISIDMLKDYLGRLSSRRNVRLRGLHSHIGSQITEIDPFVTAADKIASVADDLKKYGFAIEYINLGGGLGITYNDEAQIDISGWAGNVKRIVSSRNLKLIIEPGRYISGNSGALIVKVLYKKKGGEKTFIITDGGMNDLIRPSLYGAFQNIFNCEKREGKETVDVVGPICESGDFFAKEREITATEQGDYLAVLSAGAYGMSMASRYNSRRLPAEVIVRMDGTRRLIRKRETYEEMVADEVV